MFGPPDAAGLRVFVERSATTGAALYLLWLAAGAAIVAPKHGDTPGIR